MALLVVLLGLVVVPQVEVVYQLLADLVAEVYLL